MLYTYRAVNKLGALSEGERDAQSEAELADILRRDGLILLEDHERNPHRGRFSFSLPTIGGGVSLVERLIFARNLAVMIGAGLPLTRALGALAEQTSSQRFKIILADAQSAITTGTTFADALRKHEKVFGQLFINMIEAGEVSGNLERTLKVLARQMKRDHDLRTKVRGALIYPAIVIAALILVGVLMMVFVVPTLSKTFEELKIPLPLTTQIVLGTSGFLISYYWAVLLILAVTAFGIWRTVQMPAGRAAFDRIILRLPIFGPLIAKLNSARFARTLSSLIASGIPITRSLEITAAVLGNVHFRNALTEARDAIEHGKTLSTVLSAHTDLFPPMVTQMVAVGEETGSITHMLLRLALFYEEEVENTTKNLASVMEPVLMLFIGAVVGLFAIAMIQPIYSGVGSL